MKQAWGTRKKPHEADYMRNIKIKKLKKSCETESLDSCRKRYNFDPRSPSQRKKSVLSDFDLNKLHKITNGSAAILTCVSPKTQPKMHAVQSDLNVIRHEVVDTTQLPQTVTVVADSIDKANKTFDDFKEEFHAKFVVTSVEASNAEAITRKQANCDAWHKHRVGRVTGSKCREYVSKVHENKIVGRTTSSTKTAMGYYKEFTRGSTEWGKVNEPITCDKVFSIVKSRHTKMTCRDCGVYISHDYPFICASPDRILYCKCCGITPLEVKHPYSHGKISIDDYLNVPYACLYNRDGVITLRKNHAYYFQVQCQMFVTGAKQSIFCVNTCHPNGLFIETICYESEFVDELIAKSRIFFDEVILSELYSRKIRNAMEASEAKENANLGASTASSIVECVVPVDSTVVDLGEYCVEGTVALDTGMVVSVGGDSYTCSICKSECLTNATRQKEKSIKCCLCKMYYHASCVGVHDNPCLWFCFACSES